MKKAYILLLLSLVLLISGCGGSADNRPPNEFIFGVDVHPMTSCQNQFYADAYCFIGDVPKSDALITVDGLKVPNYYASGDYHLEAIEITPGENIEITFSHPSIGFISETLTVPLTPTQPFVNSLQDITDWQNGVKATLTINWGEVTCDEYELELKKYDADGNYLGGQSVYFDSLPAVLDNSLLGVAPGKTISYMEFSVLAINYVKFSNYILSKFVVEGYKSEVLTNKVP